MFVFHGPEFPNRISEPGIARGERIGGLDIRISCTQLVLDSCKIIEWGPSRDSAISVDGP